MITYVLVLECDCRPGIYRLRRKESKWLRGLNVHAAVKVTTALERIADGKLSNVKPVGVGVLEYRIDFGPGYRMYFGRDGDRLVILVGGGIKKRQQADINAAKAHWADYNRRRL
jgi:putative addiction module killer protein